MAQEQDRPTYTEGKPEWIFGVLLGMLGVLMLAQLTIMFVGLRECDQYAAILFEQARRVAAEQNEQVVVQAINEECSNIEEEFASVVSQWAGIILAILGGGAAATIIRRKIDRPKSRNDGTDVP